ncbi:MAG: DNA translocase FtsK 4TM domain-containing protein [Elusimicrobiota bacterium]
MSRDKNIRTKNFQRLGDVKGIALCSLALILFLGFINANIGYAGRAVINFLLDFAGYLSYAIPVFFLWWAVNEFRHKSFSFKYTFLWGFLAFLFGGSVFFHLLMPGPAGGPGGGGLIGDFLSDAVLRIALGTPGAYIVSIALIAVSLVLLADISVYKFSSDILSAAYKFLKSLSLKAAYIFSSAGRNIKYPAKKLKKEKPEYNKNIKEKKQSSLKKKTKTDHKSTEEPEIKPSGPPKIIDMNDYEIPANLLDKPESALNKASEEQQRGEQLTEVLRNFEIDAQIAAVEMGPSITRYEIEIPPGIKLSKIRNLSSNIAMALKAKTVRILTPIPGKSAVGVEVPALEQEKVYMKSMVLSTEFKNAPAAVPYCLGKSVSGENVVIDLAKMPHLLLAGATGSGKSAAIHSIINSILLKKAPDSVRLILIDPKRVELPIYKGIPHLECDVICDSQKAVKTLLKLAEIMDDRYDSLAEKNVSDINQYNKLKDIGNKMPRLVVVIDELADLMALSSDKVERAIVRIAQMARAVGIHLVLATQRPSVDVITGLIKANLPARIAFNVLSGIDSRTILDTTGAEKLLGKGDLLYLPPDLPQPLRIQGTYIDRKEIRKVVNYIKENVLFYEYDSEIKKARKKKEKANYEDELYPDAIKVFIANKKASISLIQRKLRIGYNRAARIVDTMEENGIISREDGTKAREVLVDEDYLQKITK